MSTPLNTPVLLSLEQASQLLNLKPSRLYYLTSMKRIPHLKIGSTLRFDRDEIVAWINGHRRGPRA